MKIRFESDDNLPLNKILKLTVIVSSVSEEGGKYYSQVFLDGSVYEVYMLEFDRIDISELIGINKTNTSKECRICHYWCFLDKNCKCEPYLCNGCHDFMQKAINFNDVAKGSDYRIHF